MFVNKLDYLPRATMVLQIKLRKYYVYLSRTPKHYKETKHRNQWTQ